jgi:hypothetical protein
MMLTQIFFLRLASVERGIPRFIKIPEKELPAFDAFIC